MLSKPILGGCGLFIRIYHEFWNDLLFIWNFVIFLLPDAFRILYFAVVAAMIHSESGPEPISKVSGYPWIQV